ncbi:MAG: 2Fe-2S iron-sulfur cluster-binding protein [Kiritimatiellia bacterium]|jgi:ferredoxin|nr:2Fe-2S iron-sulfur cluster-binding protein [Kiritimatiellia bacterium]MDP6847575.1 2Fe-2S iron-sulfur cluster-binding protein [Kiritimatiellia bacterium]
MPKLTIDGQVIEVEEGATVLAACRRLNIDIPTLCHRDGLPHFTSCMLCVVSSVGRNQTIPACTAKAEDGMVIETSTDEIMDLRRSALDLLLSDHLGDCEGPCRRGCPAYMDIPLMIRQIAEGRLQDAIVTVKDDIALPAVLGRICPAPCEKVCRRAEIDNPVSICLLKRYVADADLASSTPYTPDCMSATGKKVAIVGSGPTGLAAAYYLAIDGHACVIFEKNSSPGGTLREAVPPDQLPMEVLDKEVAAVRNLGAEFRMSTCVGKDVSLEQLRNDYDTVVLAIGDTKDADTDSLGIEVSGKGIEVSRKTFRVGETNLFAGGGAIGRRNLAVRAVADGKEIACSISQLLAGKEIVGRVRSFDSRLGKIREEEKTDFMQGVQPGRSVSPDIDQVIGMSPEQAAEESSRCMHCDCRKRDNCSLRRYADEYDTRQSRYKASERRNFESIRNHPEVIYEPGKCISCGICVRITEAEREELGMSFVGRGFDTRVCVPFNDSLAAGLKRTARQCVEACPTAALSFAEDVENKDV